MYDTSRHFPAERPPEQASYEGINGPWLSARYFDDADNQPDAPSSLSMQQFAIWLRSGILFHALTKTVLAGPWGIKWPVLVLICAYWTGSQLDAGVQPSDLANEVDMSPCERDLVLREARWLLDQLYFSIVRLQSMYELASQQVIPEITGFADLTTARRFVPPYLRVSDEQLSSATYMADTNAGTGDRQPGRA